MLYVTCVVAAVKKVRNLSVDFPHPSVVETKVSGNTLQTNKHDPSNGGDPRSSETPSSDPSDMDISRY